MALACFLAMQAIFWAIIQPINKRWLAGHGLKGAGGAFFALGGHREGTWTELRDRWVHAHVMRAALGLLGVVAMLLAMKTGP